MIRIKNLVSFLLLFIFFQVRSQNLVPNPSFENSDPLNRFPCDFTIFRSDFENAITDWMMPTGGTCDAYSTLISTSCEASCSSTSRFALGTQQPRTGNHMAGFQTYGIYWSPDYREYIEVKLISPLVIGKRYDVEMYVSATENTDYGTNNIGMYFSTNKVDSLYTIRTLTNLIPQIKSTAVIIDTINWTKISGTFIATTAAEYLTIGNFSNDANTSIQSKNKTTGHRVFDFSYYYIDDVSVTYGIQCNANDTSITLCKGNSVTLGSTEHTIVSWADAASPGTILSNDPTLTVSPQNNTTYVGTYDCGQTSLFEVIVNACGTNSCIPNLITPNGDGLNEFFDISCLGNENYELIICNAWGSIVYQSAVYLNNWTAADVSDGIYYYEIRYNNTSLNKGWIQVLR